MTAFKTSDGREVEIQESNARARRGTANLLTGEGLPTLLVIGARDLEPERFLEIQNRSGTAYDGVTRVNLGLMALSPHRTTGERTHIMGGGFPGTGTGPHKSPGLTSEVIPPGTEDTAVWLVSTAKARFAAVLPFAVEPEDAAEMLSEAIEGPFVIESLYGSVIRTAESLPVPGWTLFMEPLLTPGSAPAPR